LVDPEAVREWNHKAKLLTDAGVLNEAALSQLGHYCNMHAKAVQKWRLGSEPTAAEQTQLRMMATEFGFTPASKSKVGGGKSDEKNAFAELVG
jgi:phage terminase small subunit